MFRKFWFQMPINNKVRSFAVMVFLMIVVATCFNLYIMRFSMSDFGNILDENLRVQRVLDAIESEDSALHAYMEEGSDQSRQGLMNAVEETEYSIRNLPFEYTAIGADRYACTWNIRNAYEHYKKERDAVLAEDPGSEDHIRKLYEVYSMQRYISGYARRLLQQTVVAGSGAYTNRLPALRRMPFLLLNVTLFIMIVILSVSRLMTSSIAVPVQTLSEEARRIAAYDFSGGDVELENRDEIGDLGTTFNMMKHAMEDYINTLKENNQMAELLHQEQMDRLATEQLLEQNRMELLKSQINPHFLFNTLNMIGSMAELEDAETTEKMTQALAALFRYNLSTKDQIVPLAMELQVVSEYMYLQKMRFGNRVNYEVDVPADADRICIPSFTLQPLVENAVVHGISKKEQGGTVSVKAEHLAPENGTDRILLTIRDDGLGMSSERLAQLKVRLEGTDGQPAAEENSSAAGLGIGLGNIYKRVRNLYPDGTFEIWSEEGRGTAILITIPNREEE